MEIKKLAVEETSTLHIRDSADELVYTEDGKPVEIVVYGPGSKAFAKAQSANANRMLAKLKKKGNVDQTAQEKAEETAEFLAACTKEFINLEYDKLQGEALFKAVYSDNTLGFIAEQVNKHISDWSNFSKPALTK
jgi:intracellular sulfur oxidation DsrE/DsrF family protein